MINWKRKDLYLLDIMNTDNTTLFKMVEDRVKYILHMIKKSHVVSYYKLHINKNILTEK